MFQRDPRYSYNLVGSYRLALSATATEVVTASPYNYVELEGINSNLYVGASVNSEVAAPATSAGGPYAHHLFNMIVTGGYAIDAGEGATSLMLRSSAAVTVTVTFFNRKLRAGA